MKPRPTNVEIDASVSSMDQVERPPLALELPGIGPVTGYHASFAFVGEHTGPGGAAIIIAAGRKGCNCGCKSPGVGMIAYLPADEARIYAERLMQLVEAAEADASAVAKAAIDRARGR